MPDGSYKFIPINSWNFELMPESKQKGFLNCTNEDNFMFSRVKGKNFAQSNILNKSLG